MIDVLIFAVGFICGCLFFWRGWIAAINSKQFEERFETFLEEVLGKAVMGERIARARADDPFRRLSKEELAEATDRIANGLAAALETMPVVRGEPTFVDDNEKLDELGLGVRPGKPKDDGEPFDVSHMVRGDYGEYLQRVDDFLTDAIKEQQSD